MLSLVNLSKVKLTAWGFFQKCWGKMPQEEPKAVKVSHSKIVFVTMMLGWWCKYSMNCYLAKIYIVPIAIKITIEISRCKLPLDIILTGLSGEIIWSSILIFIQAFRSFILFNLFFLSLLFYPFGASHCLALWVLCSHFPCIFYIFTFREENNYVYIFISFMD